MKKQLDLIFPRELIREPVIHLMSKEFDAVIFNIRRAKVTEKVGEMVLELEGPEADLDDAISWLRKKNVRVESVVHDAIEG